MGFTLYFHFSPNDYFSNEVLTKTYELKCEPQEDDPFSFEVNSSLLKSPNRFTDVLSSRDLKSSNAPDVQLIGRKGRI